MRLRIRTGNFCCAAKLFLSHGLTNFAFVGSPRPDIWSEERFSHFCAEIKRCGFSVLNYKSKIGKGSDWAEEIVRMGDWLKELPKPCGVFAAFDQRARHVIDVCRQRNINIPKEIQVVGVDNESSLCELTVPSLSSVAPDFEAAGFAAAKELGRLMHGGRPTTRTISIKSATVVERLSTTDLTRSGDRVNRAMDFIRTHCQERIGVPQTARAVGGSIRLLEKDFKAVLGKSICTVIQDSRLQQVAKTLHASSTPLSDIARQSGFASETYLKNLFRKKYGMTMSEYRERN